MKVERQIIFHKEYFIDFYLHQASNVQEKIDYVFRIIKTVDRVPEKFMKHVEGTNGLYEIRVEYEGNIFRVFCCFDSGNIVVLFNTFQKKTQKLPIREVDLALKLKKEYFDNKTSHNEQARNKKS